MHNITSQFHTSTHALLSYTLSNRYTARMHTCTAICTHQHTYHTQDARTHIMHETHTTCSITPHAQSHHPHAESHHMLNVYIISQVCCICHACIRYCVSCDLFDLLCCVVCCVLCVVCCCSHAHRLRPSPPHRLSLSRLLQDLHHTRLFRCCICTVGIRRTITMCE